MIELDGRTEEELIDILDDLAMRRRNVAFAGSKIKALGGMGTINTPLRFGPEVRGRMIATVGAPYTVPGDDHGNPCCPHYCIGTLTEGARDVLFQGQPVVMVGHRGTHQHICNSGQAPAVVVEGWKVAYWDSKDYGLDRMTTAGVQGLGSANMDHTFKWFKQMTSYQQDED